MRDRILTTEQAAREFCVPRRTVERWALDGSLRSIEPGRYLESEVAEVEHRTRRRPRADLLLARAAALLGS